MELLSPAALWWLLALGVLLLLPQLRLPIERRFIGSLHLWRESPTDERPRPYVRLRRNMLLLLQAAAIAAIVAALAQPVLLSRGRTVALIVDLSASMAAREGNGTRMDSARAHARDVLGELPFGSRVHLFGAGARVTSAGPFDARAGELGSRISAFEPEASTAALAEAVTTARAVTDGEVIVISDSPVRAGTQDVRWIGVGSAAANIAVTTFASRALPGSPFDRQLLAEVRNYSATAVRSTVTISSSSGALHREDVALAPGGSRVVALDVAGGAGEYVARIDEEDALAADNVRRTVPSGAKVRVAIAGSVSRFVRSAVEAHSGLLVVPAGASADVVVCGAGCEDPAAGTANVLRMPGGNEDPRPIRVVNHRHELSALVSAGPFSAPSGTTVAVPPDASVIARSGTTPAVAAWQRGTQRILLLGIQDDDSRVVHDSAFPLLIAGSLDWLTKGRWAEGEHGIPREESDVRVGAASSSAETRDGARRQGRPSRMPLAAPCLLLAIVAISVEWLVLCRRKQRP